MADLWTAERILALAPDASSASSGKGLANPRKWVSSGYNDRAIWGECQGSGSKPYQTQIDLSEPAFKCSCPSRKFPCKHGLGLFLLMADGKTKAGAPPKWVEEWLATRATKAQQKAKKQEEASAQPVDPAAAAKRVAEREKKVAAGLTELDRWLTDLVRQGLASAQAQPFGYWETPASRMVDAQAPGVARFVRGMGEQAASGDGWQDRLVEAAGRLHLLVEANKRLATLSAETQADVRLLVGWPQSQDELLAKTGERDVWHVLGQTVELEDRLRAQKTYLVGAKTRRSAMVLQFAHAAQPFATAFAPGTKFDAEIVFYPGAVPLRGLIKQRHASPEPSADVPGEPAIAAVLAAYAGALAANPWVEEFPVALSAAVPVRRDDRWALADADGDAVPVHPSFPRGWHMAALSGGHPIGVFGTWDGHWFRPLSASAGGEFMSFGGGE